MSKDKTSADRLAAQANTIAYQILQGWKEDPNGDTVDRYIAYYAPKFGTTEAEVRAAMKDNPSVF